MFVFFSGKSKKRDQCKNNQVYPLSETQYCPCNKYNAQPLGNWSDCVLPEGGRMEGQLGMRVQGDIKECGQGYRYQATVCYDQDNRIVETSRCNSHGEIPIFKWPTIFSYVLETATVIQNTDLRSGSLPQNADSKLTSIGKFKPKTKEILFHWI